MKKICFALALLLGLFITRPTLAQQLDSSGKREYTQEEALVILDSIDKGIGYQTGKVKVNDIIDMNVGTGYKFVPAKSAQMIIHKLWNNPERPDILGMLVKSDFSLKNLNGWAFIVTYKEDGYVKDEEADKIDYDDLLKQIREGEEKENEAREKEGYPPLHIEGWAAKPYYDKENKVLHWAKKLRVGKGNDVSYTLNYDVRVLGRKGVLSLNAIGSMEELADISSHIPEVLKMANFGEGNKYKDFNPSMDKVAAYGIGGLIAGKLLLKVGFLGMILKYFKLILLAVGGGFAAFKRKLGGIFSKKKKDDNFAPAEEVPAQEQALLPPADENSTNA